jgi:hypothetical protein
MEQPIFLGEPLVFEEPIFYGDPTFYDSSFSEEPIFYEDPAFFQEPVFEEPVVLEEPPLPDAGTAAAATEVDVDMSRESDNGMRGGGSKEAATVAIASGGDSR